MLIFETIEDDRGIIQAVKLSNGMEFNNIPEFEKYCRSVNETIYGEGLHGLVIAIRSAGVKAKVGAPLSTGLTAKITIGKTKLIDLTGWEMGLTADKEGLAKLKKIQAIDPMLGSSPALAVNNNWWEAMGDAEAIRQARWAPSFMDAYLSSSKLPGRNFRPAYSGGMLACAAEEKVYHEVSSFDIASAYPYSALVTEVPIGTSTEVPIEDLSKLKIVDGELSLQAGYGFIGLFTVKGARRKKWVSIPFLRSSDIEFINNPIVDRIGVVSGDFRLALSPDDLRLLSLQYTFESIEIEFLSVHAIGPIPEKARDFILGAFKKKKALSKEDPRREAAKAALNTIIGFWGSCPFKSMNRSTLALDGVRYEGYVGNIGKAFDRYAGVNGEPGKVAGKKRTWDFRWAVYALAANRLRIALADKACYMAGLDVLYSDTDSIKVNGNPDIAARVFSDLNKEVVKTLDYFGIGLWVDETDGNTVGAFRGVKSYAVGTPGGVNTASISGIRKIDMAEVMQVLTLEEFCDRSLDLVVPTKRRAIANVSEGYSDPFGAKTVYPLRNILISF